MVIAPERRRTPTIESMSPCGTSPTTAMSEPVPSASEASVGPSAPDGVSSTTDEVLHERLELRVARHRAGVDPAGGHEADEVAPAARTRRSRSPPP